METQIKATEHAQKIMDFDMFCMITLSPEAYAKWEKVKKELLSLTEEA